MSDEERVLDNGVIVDSDGNLVGGKIVKNPSINSFIYNVADKDGNIIGTTQLGKVKIVVHSVEKVIEK